MTKYTNDNEEMLKSLSAAMDNDWDDEAHVSELLVQTLQPSHMQAELRSKFERYHMIRDVMHKELSPALTADFSSRISAAIADEPAIIAPTAMQRPSVENTAKSFTGVSADENAADFAGYKAKAEQKNEQYGKATPGGLFGNVVGAGIGGFAVAASAALIALVGFNVIDQSNDLQAPAFNVAATTTSPALEAQDLNVVRVAQSLTEPQDGILSIRQTFSDDVDLNQVVESFSSTPIEFVSNSGTFWVSDGQGRNVANEERLNKLLSRHIESSPTARMGGILPYSRIVGYDSTEQQKEETIDTLAPLTD